MQLEFGCDGEVLIEVKHGKHEKGVNVSIDSADADELMDSVQKYEGGTAFILERALHDVDGLTDAEINKCHGVVREWLEDHYVFTDWIDQIRPLISVFMDGADEPMDGDDVDKFMEIIRAKVDLNQGNITDEEYEKILG